MTWLRNIASWWLQSWLFLIWTALVLLGGGLLGVAAVAADLARRGIVL